MRLYDDLQQRIKDKADALNRNRWPTSVKSAQTFEDLKEILEATIEELDEIKTALKGRGIL